MSDTTSISCQIPGKLFVAGEYAVTRPGGLAIVAAVETGFTVTVRESTGSSSLQTNVALPDLTFDIHDFSVPAEGWDFALQALKNLLETLSIKDLPQLDIHISSPLGFGEQKIGYGSSASVVVGMVQAVSQFLQKNVLDFPSDFSWQKAFEAAAKAHRQVQGSGSMGDVAGIFAGGLSFYQSPEKNWQNWQLTDLNLPELSYQTYIIRTGKSVKTGNKLKIQLANDFYQKSDALIRQMLVWRQQPAYASKMFQRFKKLLLKNQQLLIDSLPAGYVTDKLALALKLVNAEANLVAKISGSGFGENLIVFAKNEKNIKKLRKKLARQQIYLEKIRISASNLRN